MAVVHDGLLYDPDAGALGDAVSRELPVLGEATGAVVGTYGSDLPPSFDTEHQYDLTAGDLSAVSPLGLTDWTFAGDGGLDTSALPTNGLVFVGSSSGMIYGLDETTGLPVWQADAGADWKMHQPHDRRDRHHRRQRLRPRPDGRATGRVHVYLNRADASLKSKRTHAVERLPTAAALLSSSPAPFTKSAAPTPQ